MKQLVMGGRGTACNLPMPTTLRCAAACNGGFCMVQLRISADTMCVSQRCLQTAPASITCRAIANLILCDPGCQLLVASSLTSGESQRHG